VSPTGFDSKALTLVFCAFKLNDDRARQSHAMNSKKSLTIRGALALIASAVVVSLLPGILVSSAVPPARFRQDTSPLAVYLEDTSFVTEKQIRNGAPYLPLIDLLDHLSIPYTDSVEDDVLSVDGAATSLWIANNSNNIILNGERIQMDWPAFREAGRWWVPMDLLNAGLAEITGIRFRYPQGAPRIFATSLTPTLLDMRAERTDSGSRLTIRSGTGINIRVQQDDAADRVTLSIDRAPLSPTRETLDYRDTAIRAIAFDDSDANSKIVIDTTDQRVNVRLVPSDENRTFVVDFVPENAPPTAANAGVPAAARPDGGTPPPGGAFEVIAIDPGHGGLEAGATSEGIAEKDLTLALAQRLRSVLASRAETRVVMTRQSDRNVSAEERSAIANNSRAGLLISLHIGFSLDESESTASVFLMQTPASQESVPGGSSLFRPWYRAQEASADNSRRFATLLGERLRRTIPSWQFTSREAPMALLASATMPAVVVELGNLNNETDRESLADPEFQTRLVNALADAIAAFRRGGI